METNKLVHDFLVIEGNIGAGKTSLSTAISRHFGCRLILERFEDNSFLPKFYNDPARFAFPLELSFLADRYQQLKDELVKQDLFTHGVVSDYIVDKSLVFARKTLVEDEYVLYKKLFDIVHASLPKPDLLVYLHRSIDGLLSNIKLRGRGYELDIKNDYLEKIQSSYMDFLRNKVDFPILIIDCEHLDFVGDERDQAWIFGAINKNYPVKINYLLPKVIGKGNPLFEGLESANQHSDAG